MEQPKRKILRLTKPRVKGILGLIFSRIFLFALLILLQLVLYGVLIGLARQYLPFYEVFDAVVTFGATLYLFNIQMDSSAKLTWLVLIALFPLPGSLLLLFHKANVGYRRMTRRVLELVEGTRTVLPPRSDVLKTLEQDDRGLDDLNRYINRSGCFPIYDDTEVRYFSLGEEKFAAMLEELEKAEHYIYMEYFIVEEGEMWGQVLEILARKAKAGLDIRVMYDGTCEISLLPHDYPQLLGKLGIKAKVFAPIAPMVSTHYNYRDHRKILVIDGKVAFTGGVNLADEYINRRLRFGHWKDTALLLRGDAAQSFTLMFLQMWNITEDTADFSRSTEQALLPPAPSDGAARGYVMPYCDNPLDEDKVGESIYMDLLYRATDYVYIMTPYLILDGELLAALRFAAERGIDVRIILPGIPDKKMAFALAKSHYKSLLDAGVRLYEYTPGFVHAKVWCSDDSKAVVGTINLDYRSLYHHFECAAYLYRCPCLSDIRADFAGMFPKCREITLANYKDGNLGYRIVGGCLKLIAPLM